MTDAVTRAYNESPVPPDSAPTLRRAPSLADWPGEYLCRPLFVEKAQLHGFAADLDRMLALLTSLPERLYDGDLDAFCAALGLDERRGAAMRMLGGGAPPHAGRADVYHDGTAFKLLEFGIGSEVGGWDRAGEIPRVLLEEDAAFASFAAGHGLGYTHTGRVLADALREAGAAVVAGGGDPVVALLEGPGGLARWGATWQPLRELMRGFGLDFRIGEIGRITFRQGKPHLDGTPVDVVYRCFEADQVYLDPEAMALVEPLCRAHEAGTVVLWTPLESNLYCEKGCLALLSDTRYRDRFSAAEQAVIDRVLPWTRVLHGDGFLADADLVARCHDRRAELILKPNGLYGGKGVVAGWETDAGEWWRAVREAAEGGCVLQERVTPRPEPVVDPLTGAVEHWQAAWGFFYLPRGHAGAYARVLPAGDSAVIGISANDKTRTAGVFHYSS
ncbi:hypothetical protein [Streptomyces aquilus]|uniref:hypothetical protein n=1 Tax=Streptomyces aquilus TaxID=2548456 RepID=UPI0036970A16